MPFGASRVCLSITGLRFAVIPNNQETGRWRGVTVAELSWTHVGRLWTSGDPHLAVDATLRGNWRGASDEDLYQDLFRAGEPPATSVSVGAGRAAIVGGEAAAGGDAGGGWIEVFAAGAEAVAFVQASGPDYGAVLRAALAHPVTHDDKSDLIEVRSGNLTVFSAALDGAGEHAAELISGRPGSAPLTVPAAAPGPQSGLLLSLAVGGYRLRVRPRTPLADDRGSFARWLFLPAA
jgi:hypothetical protein